MTTVPLSKASELLNLVGFATGTALYALLLVLVLRTRRSGLETAGAPDRLPLVTALLGLVWNLGEVLAYVLPRAGVPGASVALSALSLPALALLAAVVVHSVARSLGRGIRVAAIAYTCSASAGLLHVFTAVTGDPSASARAFTALTICYAVLIVLLGALTRGQPNGQRAVWMLALALFAVSASHLGQFHGADSHWLAELAGHHAAIPLAFAILYQDYRFAFADLFLKHALTLLVVVAIAFASYAAIAALPPREPLAVGALLALWVATALVYPGLRAWIARFVDTVILDRPDFRALRAELAREVTSQDSVSGVLDAVVQRLAPALNAERLWWMPQSELDRGSPQAAVQVEVRTTDHPSYLLHVGRLAGGRRLLSDELSLVEAAAAVAARRIDQLRLASERYERRLREEEMRKLAVEAELRALRAQINPHFLFNALTTIGYLIETAPTRALETLMRLTSLLRAVLRPDGEFTTLGRELDLVEHYLDIERARFEERLQARIDVPEALRGLNVPSLVLQPLVENAVKHGIAPSPQGGEVVVSAALVSHGASRRLRLWVSNTGTPGGRAASDGGGLGLANVRRRLAGYFGSQASLAIRSQAGSTLAEIELPALGDVGFDAALVR